VTLSDENEFSVRAKAKSEQKPSSFKREIGHRNNRRKVYCHWKKAPTSRAFVRSCGVHVVASDIFVARATQPLVFLFK
jgi:hypothetical protein